MNFKALKNAAGQIYVNGAGQVLRVDQAIQPDQLAMLQDASGNLFIDNNGNLLCYTGSSSSSTLFNTFKLTADDVVRWYPAGTDASSAWNSAYIENIATFYSLSNIPAYLFHVQPAMYGGTHTYLTQIITELQGDINYIDFIGPCAFRSQYFLTGNYTFDNCSYIGESAFETVGQYAGVTSMNFPVVEYIDSRAFEGASIATLSLGSTCSYIGGLALDLKTGADIYIGYPGVISWNMPLMSSFSGYIYVPTDYVSAYKSAQGWSKISSRIYGY